MITLTAGTGGSLLAIGSAAGVGLLGTARGIYTFGSHLKWAPVIAIGYAASILAHLFVNAVPDVTRSVFRLAPPALRIRFSENKGWNRWSKGPGRSR